MAATASPTAFPWERTPLPSLPTQTTPTYNDMKRLHLRINADTMSVFSAGGNGRLGHLALVVPPATYEALSGGVPFVAPEHPGTHPVHPAGATAAQITEGNRAHLALTNVFNTSVAVETAIKTRLLAAVPHEYIEELADDDVEYGNQSVLAILTHLDTKFGTITSEQLRDNSESLDRDWSPVDTSIDTFWSHIKERRAFATAGGNPISERTVVGSVIANFERNGLFPLAINKWNDLDSADQTFERLKSEFTKADKERRRLLTVRAAGFHGNAVAAAATNTTPAEQALVAPAAAPPSLGTTAPKAWHYCWSHGTNSSHASTDCRHPQSGHNNAATFDNMLGGCNLIQRRRGERAVWKAPPRRAANAATAPAAAPTASD